MDLKIVYGVGLAIFVSMFVLLFTCNVEARKKKPKISSAFEIKDELIGDLHTKVLSNNKTGIVAIHNGHCMRCVEPGILSTPLLFSLLASKVDMDKILDPSNFGESLQ